jgi:hypothetical protein
MRRAGSRGACALLSPGLTPPPCPLPTSQEKAAQRKQHAMTRHRDPRSPSTPITHRRLAPRRPSSAPAWPWQRQQQAGKASPAPAGRAGKRDLAIGIGRARNEVKTIVEQQCCGCGPLPSLALDRASGGHHHLAVEGGPACGCGSAGLPCPCRCRAGGREVGTRRGLHHCMHGAACRSPPLLYCIRNVRGEATERVRAGAATFALHVHVVGSRRGRAVLPARALPDCRSLSLSLPVPMRPCPPPRPRESSRERWRAVPRFLPLTTTRRLRTRVARRRQNVGRWMDPEFSNNFRMKGRFGKVQCGAVQIF